MDRLPPTQDGEAWLPVTPERDVVVHVHWELETQWHSTKVLSATALVHVFPVTPCRATEVELDVWRE